MQDPLWLPIEVKILSVGALVNTTWITDYRNFIYVGLCKRDLKLQKSQNKAIRLAEGLNMPPTTRKERQKKGYHLKHCA